jgi:hypothetical protein
MTEPQPMFDRIGSEIAPEKWTREVGIDAASRIK